MRYGAAQGSEIPYFFENITNSRGFVEPEDQRAI